MPSSQAAYTPPIHSRETDEDSSTQKHRGEVSRTQPAVNPITREARENRERENNGGKPRCANTDPAEPNALNGLDGLHALARQLCALYLSSPLCQSPNNVNTGTNVQRVCTLRLSYGCWTGEASPKPETELTFMYLKNTSSCVQCKRLLSGCL